MSNQRSLFVNYDLSNDSSELSMCDLSAEQERFDWIREERGLDLRVIDKENSIQGYLEGIEDRMNWIARRKEILYIWSNGASDNKLSVLRKEYAALLFEEKCLNSPVIEMESEIDFEFSEFQGGDSFDYLPKNTVDSNLYDFYQLYVDGLDSEDLNKSIDYLQLMFEEKKIYYKTWVELSLVCYARAKDLVTPQSYEFKGVVCLKTYNAGYEEEYQKFLKMYQKIIDFKREKEAACSYYDLRSKSYMSEDEIIAALDGREKDSWNGSWCDSDISCPVDIPKCNEHTMVLDALVSTGGNKSEAGKLLGVSRTTVRRRLVKAVEAAKVS